MSQHVPEDLLQSFVEGDMGEQLAVHIAEHVDSCPACATRATGLEPLAAAFAAIEDPVAPEGLAESVLALMRRPERIPRFEIVIGSALLLTAALLALGLQSPIALAADFGASFHAIEAVGRGLLGVVGSSQLTLVLSTLIAAAGCAVTVQIARGGLPGADRIGWGDPAGRAP